MDFKISKLKFENLNEAMNVVKEVFMEFEAPDYSNTGVDSFLDYISLKNIEKLMKNKEIELWISTLENKIVGVVAMRKPCHISLLFVDKKFHRMGIARQLFSTALKEYKAGETLVTVNSSPYAVKAYEKLGFVKNGSEQVSSGIIFQPMVLEDYSKYN